MHQVIDLAPIGGWVFMRPMKDIDQLRNDYCNLVNHLLPAAAPVRRFPIRFNHCFIRVILDNLFEDVWYDHLSKKGVPAYRQLTEAQLRLAVDIAENILDSPNEYLENLNRNSLAWRNKL